LANFLKSEIARDHQLQQYAEAKELEAKRLKLEEEEKKVKVEEMVARLKGRRNFGSEKKVPSTSEINRNPVLSH
jgi:hypothetical protein